MKNNKELRKAIGDFKKLTASDVRKSDKAIYDIVKILIDRNIVLVGEVDDLKRQLNKVL